MFGVHAIRARLADRTRREPAITYLTSGDMWPCGCTFYVTCELQDDGHLEIAGEHWDHCPDHQEN